MKKYVAPETGVFELETMTIICESDFGVGHDGPEPTDPITPGGDDGPAPANISLWDEQ